MSAPQLSFSIQTFLTKDQAENTVETSKIQRRVDELNLSAVEMKKSQTLKFTQLEIIQKLQVLRSSLQNNWKSEKYVEAVKIAVNTAKDILPDSRVPLFYPSQFLSVTAILDSFGQLVFNRLSCVAIDPNWDQNKTKRKVKLVLPTSIHPDQVSEASKHLCRNWFWKVGSIRELIARLYIELALLRCYSFLHENPFPTALRRCASMCRGIGDPLVATYVRMYVVNKGLLASFPPTDDDVTTNSDSLLSVSSENIQASVSKPLQDNNQTIQPNPEYDIGYIETCIKDSFYTLSKCHQAFLQVQKDPTLRSRPEIHNMMRSLDVNTDKKPYGYLFIPCIDYMIHAYTWLVKNKIGNASYDRLFSMYSTYSNLAFVLAPMLKYIPHEIISSDVRVYTALVRGLKAESTLSNNITEKLQMNLYNELLTALIACPPRSKVGKIVFNDIWSDIVTWKNHQYFLQVVNKAMPFALKSFDFRQLNYLLQAVYDIFFPILNQQNSQGVKGIEIETNDSSIVTDKIVRVTTDMNTIQSESLKANDSKSNIIHLILSILTFAMEGMNTFDDILQVSSFLSLIDLIHDDSSKSSMAMSLIETFGKFPNTTHDVYLIHRILDLAKNLAASVDTSSEEKYIDKVCKTINSFILIVDFGRDFQKQLEFYTQCRQHFCNLDQTLYLLIQKVAQLTMDTLKIMKGKHSKKTKSFCNTCLSYCFISIPTLISTFDQFSLYAFCGQCAVINGSLNMADSFMIKATETIPKVLTSRTIGLKQIDIEQVFTHNSISLIGNLVVIPGHPEHGPLYLYHGVFNAIKKYPWTKSIYQYRFYPYILASLATCTRPTFPYHIPNVDSNDSLYFGDHVYLTKTLSFCQAVIAQFIEYFQKECKPGLVETQVLTHFYSVVALDERLRKLTKVLDSLDEIGRKIVTPSKSAFTTSYFEFLRQFGPFDVPDENILEECPIEYVDELYADPEDAFVIQSSFSFSNWDDNDAGEDILRAVSSDKSDHLNVQDSSPSSPPESNTLNQPSQHSQPNQRDENPKNVKSIRSSNRKTIVAAGITFSADFNPDDDPLLG